MPGGSAQDVLLLTIAGRFAPTRGTVSVFGDTTPRAIRRHCAIAAFADIDDLDESVTVHTALIEQCRWLAPWYARVPATAGRDTMEEVFGDNPVPPRITTLLGPQSISTITSRVPTLGAQVGRTDLQVRLPVSPPR